MPINAFSGAFDDLSGLIVGTRSRRRERNLPDESALLRNEFLRQPTTDPEITKPTPQPGGATVSTTPTRQVPQPPTNPFAGGVPRRGGNARVASDIPVEHARTVLVREFRRATGRDPDPGEVEQMLRGQGLKPGDRFVGQAGLQSVINQVYQNAQQDALLEQSAPVADPVPDEVPFAEPFLGSPETLARGRVSTTPTPGVGAEAFDALFGGGRDPTTLLTQPNSLGRIQDFIRDLARNQGVSRSALLDILGGS